MERESLLRVENLRLSFSGSGKKVEAVRDVSFTIFPGETLALVGESGCGKTALCRSILMLHNRHAEIEGGNIFLYGKKMNTLCERELESVRGTAAAMVFQDPMTALDPTVPIGRQIMEPMLLHRRVKKAEAAERAVRLLKQVGIDRAEERFRQYPHHFSGGMRQRAAIAIALSADPKLLIADEPTTALDPAVQDKIVDLLLRLCREKEKGLLFVTHDLGLARRAADRTAVMKDGVIVEMGKTEELFHSPRHPYTRKLAELAEHGKGRESRHPFFSISDIEAAAPYGGDVLVRVENLTKSFPLGRGRADTVLKNLNLTVRRGETVGIVGPSGCGKSTLARCIMGLYDLQGGRVSFAKGCRKQMIFQDSASAFNPRMTIEEIIAEPLVIKKAGDKKFLRKKVAEVMEETELAKELSGRHPYDVSGGQRQRAAMARALITDPDFLVCDEPVSSLDIASQVQIIDLLKKLRQERNLAVLLITHDIPMIEEIADRVITLEKQGQERRKE